MSPASEVTVVVVTWQARDLLAACLESLRGQSIPHDVLVVDNASTDGTRELLTTAHFSRVRVLRLATNTGFAGGVAAALPHVDTRFLALLNDDAEADPGWLAAATADLRKHPDLAAVSSRMLLPGEPARINNAGVVLRRDGYGADRGLGDLDGPEYAVDAEVFGASGGAAVYRTLAVKAVGGVPAEYFLYYEDTDLAWRLRLAGWRVGYCPAALVRHQHAASSQPGSPRFAFYTERNRLLTLARCAPAWFSALQLGRFVLTSASLAAKRATGRPLPSSAVFSVPTRARALASAVRLAPGLLAVRSRSTRRQRARVLADWRGIEARPAPGGGGPAGSLRDGPPIRHSAGAAGTS